LSDPGIFGQRGAFELFVRQHQLRNQRKNLTSNNAMKYTQPAIAIIATLKNAPSNARCLIFARGNAARAFWSISIF